MLDHFATLGNLAVFGFLPNLGPMEMMVIVGLGVLLFGKRLPEVGRSLGKGIVEFKKGLKGIEDEVDEASSRPNPQRSDDRVHAEAPKFEIPPAPTKSERT